MLPAVLLFTRLCGSPLIPGDLQSSTAVASAVAQRTRTTRSPGTARTRLIVGAVAS